MNFTNKDFSFTIYDPVGNDNELIIKIDEDDFIYIVDNIEFGSSYSYEILTLDGDFLTKDGLLFESFFYTLPPLDILSIVADLSFGMRKDLILPGAECFLSGRPNTVRPNKLRYEYLERLIKLEALDLSRSGSSLFDLKLELEKLISKSDFANKLYAEKETKVSYSSTPEGVPINRSLSLSLVHSKL